MKKPDALEGASSIPQSRLSELPPNIIDFTATQLSSAIQQRHVSCVEVMRAYLAQIDTYNPIYNAIVNRLPEQQCIQMATAADTELDQGRYRGWMHGMPFAVKELVDVEGFVTSFGSLAMAKNVAKSDSLMAERIKAEGALVFAKTNIPEFGFGSQSYNQVYGVTGSAYDPALTAGGSSGGAACAMRTKMLPVADGSDMMGSLRNPAAFNNVIGFRPSFGRVPGSTGGEVFYNQLATSGPMGRNVRDTIQLYTSIAGGSPKLPLSLRDKVPSADSFLPMQLKGLKIGWLKDYGGYLPTEPGLLDLCEENFVKLEQEGVVVEECTPKFDMERLWDSWRVLRQQGIYADLRNLYADESSRAVTKPEAIWEIENGMKLTTTDIATANAARSSWFRAMLKLFEAYDFLMLPSAQLFPFSKDIHWPQEIDGRKMDTYHRWMEVVIGGSLGGGPVVNVPAGFDKRGRPMGLQVLAPFGEDKRTLEFAMSYERLTGHLDREPVLVANRNSAAT